MNWISAEEHSRSLEPLSGRSTKATTEALAIIEKMTGLQPPDPRSEGLQLLFLVLIEIEQEVVTRLGKLAVAH